MAGMLLLIGCAGQPEQHKPDHQAMNDTALFNFYLQQGNAFYATKASYTVFEQSLTYFDSAKMVAQRTKDPAMMASAVFAEGRVYDAFGKNKEKTISLFQEAADRYRAVDGAFVREYYVRHLIAHAYDKANDSIRCIGQLQMMYDTLLRQPDSIRQQMGFIPQMAYISTVVNNYDLSEKILSDLYQRNWIKNEPDTYNYEDFYFLTRLKTDVYKHKNFNSPFRDSFMLALGRLNNPIDSLWYLDELLKVLGDAQQFELAYKLSKTHNDLNSRVLDSEGIGSLQNKLLNLELQNERKKLEQENKDRRNRNIILLILTTGFLAVSALGYRLYRLSQRYRQQKNRLAVINAQLDIKVKEIQHRVKNNLHLMFSLLNMQERRSKNPDTIQNLQQARLRIESIAGLHDQLNQNNHQYVDFNAYVQKLIQTIINCIETEHQVVTDMRIDPISVPNHYYIPIGLILNEWITNSIKYAKTDAALVLSINMQQTQNSINIHYADNGQTVPQRRPPNPGLGTEIISLLTRQLKGTLHTNPERMFEYHLTIPCRDEGKN